MQKSGIKMLGLLLFFMFGNVAESKAQGWSYDFSNVSIDTLIKQGFSVYNFQSGTSGITSHNLKNIDSAVIKTPCFYLGIDNFFTFSGARINNATGNGIIYAQVYMEDIFGNVVELHEFQMHDAASADLPSVNFETHSRGFYRITIKAWLEGNKNIYLHLSSITSNLPNVTYTPEEASQAFEIRGRVFTDRTVYIVSDTAIFNYKVKFDAINNSHLVKKARYHMVVPNGFKIINANVTVIRGDGGPVEGNSEIISHGIMGTENIDFDVESGDLMVQNGTIGDEVDIELTLEAETTGEWQAEAILTEYEPIITNEDTNDSTDTIIILPDGSLPIKLLSFKALEGIQYNTISWATALEINNDYFSLERSFDGFNFESIGNIPGNGNSSGIHHYAFKDLDFKHPTLYYRLVQFDFDGENSTSELVKVSRNIIVQEEINVFPNPFNGELMHIELDLSKQSVVDVKLVNLRGETIYSNRIADFNKSQSSIQLSGLNLPNGVYYLILGTDSNTKQTIKKLLVKN